MIHVTGTPLLLLVASFICIYNSHCMLTNCRNSRKAQLRRYVKNPSICCAIVSSSQYFLLAIPCSRRCATIQGLLTSPGLLHCHPPVAHLQFCYIALKPTFNDSRASRALSLTRHCDSRASRSLSLTRHCDSRAPLKQTNKQTSVTSGTNESTSQWCRLPAPTLSRLPRSD
jgi:hypothetical protein